MRKARAIYVNRWIIACILFSLLAMGWCYFISPVLSQSSARVEVFEAAWKTVNENFFDPNFNGVDWQKLHRQYKPKATQARSTEQLATIINQMLGELHTSHTHFYTANEPAYYQIAGIFRRYLLPDLKPLLPDGKLEYTGIGIYTEEIEGQIFIKAIINGSAAAQAELEVGDRLVSVDGKPFNSLASFAGKAGQQVSVLIQRTSDTAPQEIVVVPKYLIPLPCF